MERLEWSSRLEIGNSIIDLQHQKFVSIINKLQDAFFSAEDVNIEEIQKTVFKELLEYTRYHFASEEKLMQESNYPESSNHWRLHKDFDRTIYEKFRALQQGECILTSDLLMLIQTWLVNHILVEDQKFGKFLRDCQ